MIFSVDDANTVPIYIIYRRLVIFIKVLFVFHALFGFWALWLKQKSMDEATLGHKEQPEHVNEGFHLAMYHLSSNNSTYNCCIDDNPGNQNKGNISKSLSLVCTVLVLCTIAYFIAWWRSQESIKPKKRKQVQRRIKEDVFSPKHSSTLKRELLSREVRYLGSSNEVDTSFVENVILSNGKLSSVKRSARIRLLKFKSESLEPITLFAAKPKLKKNFGVTVIVDGNQFYERHE